MDKRAARLLEPFGPDEIKWRAGTVSRDGKKAMMLAYLTSRAVMERLDDVFGVFGWEDRYQDLPGGGVECTIRVWDEDRERWIEKTDAADPTQIEGTKGGRSDSLKRAAVKLGIGRYLYSSADNWAQVKEGWARNGGINISSKGKHVGWIDRPTLRLQSAGARRVQEAQEAARGADVAQERRKESPEQTEQRRATHHDSWEADRKAFCAAITKASGGAFGYDDVKAWALSQGWPAPSAWISSKRVNLIGAIDDNKGGTFDKIVRFKAGE